MYILISCLISQCISEIINDKKVTWGVILVMMLIAGIVLLQVSMSAGRVMCVEDAKEAQPSSFIKIIPRAEWQARAPRQLIQVPPERPYVVIHHSYLPPACYSSEQCAKAMRSMQDFHMDDRKWWDIGYNFAVGSDESSSVYEGRGWGVQGAHALRYNNVSVGICLIGDWTQKLPPRGQLEAAQEVIRLGVSLGWISPDYKLVGHRQMRDTECPGDALYSEIQTWPHYTPLPISFKVKESSKPITNLPHL